MRGPRVLLGAKVPCLYSANPYTSTMIIVMIASEIQICDDFLFCFILRIGPNLFYIGQFFTQFKTKEKMIGHRTRFRENDYLHLRHGLAVKKKNRHFLMRAR